MTATLLVYVMVERFLELVIASRNTRRLMARGAQEFGASHYPFMVALHVAWLAAILGWAAFGPYAFSPLFLVLYLLLQGLRIWVMMSLGSYWTTRIIRIPDAPLVTAGPYKFMQHPNYALVALEIATLPLVFGAWPIAAIFSLLNAAMLSVRIRAENQALKAGG